MLPNLIFLFNLSDVIPPNVQLWGKLVTHNISCELFETCHDSIKLTYVSRVILFFFSQTALSCSAFYIPFSNKLC